MSTFSRQFLCAGWTGCFTYFHVVLAFSHCFLQPSITGCFSYVYLVMILLSWFLWSFWTEFFRYIQVISTISRFISAIVLAISVFVWYLLSRVYFRDRLEQESSSVYIHIILTFSRWCLWWLVFTWSRYCHVDFCSYDMDWCWRTR
jgi:hypothetical protein